MIVDRSAPRAALVLIAIGLLFGGCGRAGAPGAPASAVASIEPTASVEPSVPPAGEPSQASPPAASIAVDGGDPVGGQLGSYTWHGAGSDAPWLDGSPIHVGAAERLSVSLVEAVGVANWTASRVPPGNRDGIGAIGLGEGFGEPVTFGTPPKGSWSVNVTVWFSDDRGSAAYYWLMNVD